MAVFTNINLSDSTIDWCLSCYNDETELLRATDRCFFNIDLYEGGHIKVQNTPTQLSDIRGLAVDYIFYLDSASRRCIFTRRNINQEEELEISGAGVYMKVHIEDNNGFSISDWLLSALRRRMVVFTVRSMFRSTSRLMSLTAAPRA